VSERTTPTVLLEAVPNVIPASLADRIVAALAGRSEEQLYGSVVLLAGCIVLLAGLDVVAVSPDWGFTYPGAWTGILSQLPVTLPAAVLVAGAAAANVAAGALLLRLAGGRPYRSITDFALGGFATAAIADAALLFVLGSLGLFGWPELLVAHAGVAGLALARRATSRREAGRRHAPAWTVFDGPVRPRLRRPLAWWPLVLMLWSGPLNVSPSPIYGPSRLMLGYVATLGTLTTLTNLHAILAEAAFATPLAILLALALRRATGAMFGGSSSFWILVAFPLTFTFSRIPDTRGTVEAFPLALYALALVADELRVVANWRDDPPFRPDLALTFALAGAVLVHPLIGMFAWAAALAALILYPLQLGPRLIPALAGSAVMSLPQVLTMSAVAAPSWIGFVLLAAGLATAFAVAAAIAVTVRALRDAEIAEVLADWSFDTTWTSGFCRITVIVFGIATMLRITQTHMNFPEDWPEVQIDSFARLVGLALLGSLLALLRPQRGWILVGCAIGAAASAWATASMFGDASLTQLAIHYEVPKTVEYWIPTMLALGSAAAISAVWRLRRLGFVRPLAVFGFLLVSLYPFTQPLALGPVKVDTSLVEAPLAADIAIGEHRGAESLGLALREADLGYWDFLGYPDARNVIDEQRQQVVDEIRSLEAEGRIGPSTQILHVASDFQQWTSVPIGVFTGAIETSVSLDPIANIHTEGGRLYGFGDLDTLLRAHPGFVVLEPQNLDATQYDGVVRELTTHGYREIWSNWQAEIYAPK